MLQLLLPSDDDGLTVDDNSLVYKTHSLIDYAMKEKNCKFRPCHGISLVEITCWLSFSYISCMIHRALKDD